MMRLIIGNVPKISTRHRSTVGRFRISIGGTRPTPQMTVCAFEDHDLGTAVHGRCKDVVVCVDEIEGEWCDRCKAKTRAVVLQADSSCGEYGPVSLCMPCILAITGAFKRKHHVTATDHASAASCLIPRAPSPAQQLAPGRPGAARTTSSSPSASRAG